MYWKFNSIKKRLIGFFMLIILIPTIAFSILIYIHQKNSLYDTRLAHLQAVADLKESAIQSWLVEEKYLISLLANQPYIQRHGSILLSERPTTKKFKQSFHALKQYFHSIPGKMQDILSISILSNVGGRTILSTDEKLIGKYHLSDSFFTLGKSKTYVQRIHYSSFSNDPTLIIATPLTNRAGDKLGVLYVELDPIFITRLMTENSNLGKTGKTYLVDSRKNLITPIYHENLKHKKISNQNIKQGLKHLSGNNVTTDFYNHKVLSVYRWLDEPKTVLMAEMDIAEIYAPLQTFLIKLILSAIIISILAFIIAIAIANTISKPIIALTDTARQISSGNLGKRVLVTSNDEIGVLSDAFNEMTESLQKTITDKDNTYTELQKTNQELERATLAKSTFLANMSHELRTPLHAIIGFSQIMVAEKEKIPSKEWLEYINTINTAGNHLLKLISDLLDLSKAETGALDLLYSEVDIETTVKDVIRIAQPLIEKSGNKLHIIGLEHTGKMHADSKRLQQILLNLLSNAAKFTDQGEISLALTFKQIENEEWIQFSISDTGIGITDEELDHVFEKFNQADSSFTRKYEGSGLGLSITKYLCESMGGSIQVTSQKDHGTEFVIYLPRWSEQQLQVTSA